MTPKSTRTLVLALILAGSLFVAFFGLRTLRAFGEVRGHRPLPSHAENPQQIETDVEMIREWMTIPFIAKTYHVPASVLFDTLGIPPDRNRDKSLKRLNKEYFPGTKGYVLDTIKATVLANQNQQIQDQIPLIPSTPTPAHSP